MHKNIIKKLQAYMNARGLTVAEISVEVGVEPQTVGYWLEGMHMPRPGNVERILQLLQTPVGASKLATPVSPGFETDVLQQLSQLLQRLTLLESTIANAADLYLEQAIALEARALAGQASDRPSASNQAASPV